LGILHPRIPDFWFRHDWQPVIDFHHRLLDRFEDPGDLRAQRGRTLMLMSGREDAARPWTRRWSPLAALVFVTPRWDRMQVAHAQNHICHDPNTMQLRITRPGFIEGIRALKASQGVANYDVHTMATRPEMRSFVCGPCHVEYYAEVGHKDWTHADTGADVLKAQHPEFETWSQGIHARSGVACADCHMPCMREGALKISDHHVRSPLLNITRACQTCHKWSEQELKARAETIQERTFQLRNLALDALVALIGGIKAAREVGATSAQLAVAQQHQRRAQFLLDFCEAENSMGFHAPQESARILGQSIDQSRRGQVGLREPFRGAGPKPAQ
jgi:nitrite reductase (cytochrome c-552)